MASKLIIDRIPPDMHVDEKGNIVWTPRLIDFNSVAYSRGHVVTSDEFNTELIKQTYQGNYNTDTISVLIGLYNDLKTDVTNTANTANTNAATALSRVNIAEANSIEALGTANDALTTSTEALSDAQAAVNASVEAVTTSENALNISESAMSLAEDASDRADAAVLDAEEAMRIAEVANNVSIGAEEIALTANSLSNIANTNASTALSTAENAFETSTEAKSIANAAAYTAGNASTTANTASTNASTALSTAYSADTNATQALTNSSTALSVANNASTTANAAKQESANAISVANAANTKSDNAVNSANQAVNTASEALKNVTESLGTQVTVGGQLVKTFNADSKLDVWSQAEVLTGRTYDLNDLFYENRDGRFICHALEDANNCSRKPEENINGFTLESHFIMKGENPSYRTYIQNYESVNGKWYRTSSQEGTGIEPIWSEWKKLVTPEGSVASATAATKATQDGDGKVIKNTYTKLDGSNYFVRLAQPSDNGGAVGFRHIATCYLGNWSHKALSLIIKSRHSGTGLLTIGIATHGSITNNLIGSIKFYGSTDATIKANSWKMICDTISGEVKVYWRYWDGDYCEIKVLDNNGFTTLWNDGEWLTTEPTTGENQVEYLTLSYDKEYLPLTGGTLTGNITAPSITIANNDHKYLTFTTADGTSMGRFRGASDETGMIAEFDRFLFANKSNGNRIWIEPATLEFRPETDNTYTVGTSSKRFASGYFAGTVSANLLGGNAVYDRTSINALTAASTWANNTRVPTINTIAYWDGRYQTTSNASNLAYCKHGALGTMATKTATTKNLTLNGGTALPVYATNTTAMSWYAPTAAGTSGQILKSNGSGAPTWGTVKVYQHTVNLKLDQYRIFLTIINNSATAFTTATLQKYLHSNGFTSTNKDTLGWYPCSGGTTGGGATFWGISSNNSESSGTLCIMYSFYNTNGQTTTKAMTAINDIVTTVTAAVS